MDQSSARKRLCQVILGNELRAGQTHGVTVSVPVLYEDIDKDVLGAAHEAIYGYCPSHVRQILPFVLQLISEQRSNIDDSGFVDTFFLHVNYAFCLENRARSIGVADEAPRYRTEYRENWVAGTISAMNRFEHSWAYDWVCELLKTDIPVSSLYTRQDLIMFARILGMALGKRVTDVPSF